MKLSYNKKEKHKGFTLIETLVAISVLLIAVAAPLTLASRSLSSATRAREKLIATYLALEGVEIVRNIRDENVRSGELWSATIGVCIPGDYCTIDPSRGTPIQQNCGGESCPELWFNEETGQYAYRQTSGWEQTRYIRSFYANALSNDELEIIVSVSYDVGFTTKDITIRDHLFSWQ